MTTPPDDGLLTQVKQYRLVRELGRGGMGVVYEAVDTRDGGRVAVKMLHPWLVAEDTAFRDRFEREAHIAALLRSPYSVRLLDFGVSDGTYFLVMEYVEGTTVGSELKKGPIEVMRALRIAIDVARALEEAASHSVVHRDIKPDNILLTQDGPVKVTDFGIARHEGGTGLTSAGGFVGTPDFAAPEQATGETDHRTDIYSLGATLYCMLAGRPPFQAGTVFELLRMHQSTQVPMEPLANLPDAIVNPVRRCLEKDPRDRYQTATEFAGALERALSGYLRTQTGATGSRGAARSGAPQPTAPLPATAGMAAQPGGPTAATAPVGPQPEPQPVTHVAARPATPAPPAPAAVPPPITMTAQAAGLGAPGVTRCEVIIQNGGQTPVRLSLTAVEPSGLLVISLPPAVVLGAGETQRVPVEVRQSRPVPKDARVLQFQVTAMRDDGTRAAFANVTLSPAAVAAGGTSGRWLLIGGAGVAVAVAGVFGVLMLTGGGDETSKTTPAPATAGTSATVAPSAAASGTPGATAPGATTAAPTPAKSIKVLDQWNFDFTVVTNTCSFGAAPGATWNGVFRFRPANSNASVINDGDRVTITAIQDREFQIGTFTFRYTGFEFSYAVAGSSGQRGTAVIKASFAGDQAIADASLTETYESPNCTITGRRAN